MRHKLCSHFSIFLLSYLALVVTAQGPCSNDSDCPSGFFLKQYCDTGRCMPTSCTGASFKGCQQFDKRTYCPARTGNVKCAPRLQAGQVCQWIPDFGEEQPCAPGLVCSGWHTMTCVRGGKGPLTAPDGLPKHQALAEAAAAEIPDDSIPPRPGSTGGSPSNSPSGSQAAPGASPTNQGSFPQGGNSNAGPNMPVDPQSAMSSTLIIFGAVAGGILLLSAVTGLIARARRKRYAPRPPTTSAPKPNLPPPPSKPADSTQTRPYGSPIEQQVEYVTVGQPTAVVEVPLEEYMAQAARGPAPMAMPQPAYMPASPPPVSMPMPQPAQLPTPYSRMPTPQIATLDTGSHPSPSFRRASPLPTTHVMTQPDPCDGGAFQTGQRVEVHAGPDDAELVLPGPSMRTA